MKMSTLLGIPAAMPRVLITVKRFIKDIDVKLEEVVNISTAAIIESTLS